MIQSQDLALVHPGLHPTAGFGMIVHHEQLPNNRYNIVILGLGRLFMESELESDRLYRIAQGRLIDEDDTFDTTPLMMLFTQIIMHSPEISGKFDMLLKEEVSARTKINVIAQLVLQDADERQVFISTESVERQVDILSERLAELLLKTTKHE